MNNENVMIISSGIVLVNIIIGNLFPPNGILLIPIVLIVLALIIGKANNELNSILKSILLTVFISIHDIGIKLFSGGVHDYEGLGFIHLLLFVGLIPAFGILLYGIVRDKNETEKNKWMAILLFPILVGIHLMIFKDVGIGRN